MTLLIVLLIIYVMWRSFKRNRGRILTRGFWVFLGVMVCLGLILSFYEDRSKLAQKVAIKKRVKEGLGKVKEQYYYKNPMDAGTHTLVIANMSDYDIMVVGNLRAKGKKHTISRRFKAHRKETYTLRDKALAIGEKKSSLKLKFQKSGNTKFEYDLHFDGQFEKITVEDVTIKPRWLSKRGWMLMIEPKKQRKGVWG